LDGVKSVLFSDWLNIAGAIASFASNIPEIVELVGNQPKYSGSYKVSGSLILLLKC
jgi:hypothetical protein